MKKLFKKTMEGVSVAALKLATRKELKQSLIQDESGLELGTLLAILGISLVLILVIFAFAKPWVNDLINKMRETSS
jgi:hypothetical protein